MMTSAQIDEALPPLDSITPDEPEVAEEPEEAETSAADAPVDEASKMSDEAPGPPALELVEATPPADGEGPSGPPEGSEPKKSPLEK